MKKVIIIIAILVLAVGIGFFIRPVQEEEILPIVTEEVCEEIRIGEQYIRTDVKHGQYEEETWSWADRPLIDCLTNEELFEKYPGCDSTICNYDDWIVIIKKECIQYTDIFEQINETVCSQVEVIREVNQRSKE